MAARKSSRKTKKPPPKARKPRTLDKAVREIINKSRKIKKRVIKKHRQGLGRFEN